MQKIYLIIIILVSPYLIFGQNDISLKGVIDFDLVSAGYTGKAIHLVANTNISDLSSYGIGVANMELGSFSTSPIEGYNIKSENKPLYKKSYSI